MAVYRCHFLDVRDRIEAHEEIEADTLSTPFIGRRRCWPKDHITTWWRFGQATGGSTAPGTARHRNRTFGINETAGIGDVSHDPAGAR